VAVRRGDNADPAGLLVAFEGADQLLLVSSNDPGADALSLHRTAIDAAVNAGVGRILCTSHQGAALDTPFGPGATTPPPSSCSPGPASPGPRSATASTHTAGVGTFRAVGTDHFYPDLPGMGRSTADGLPATTMSSSCSVTSLITWAWDR